MSRIQLGILGLLVTVLTAGTVYADWSYAYRDDFEGDLARSDSHAHSSFWPLEITPPPEPYLYYSESDDGQGLAFIGYGDQPAELSYCFPLGSAQGQRAVKGTLTVDVSFPTTERISQYTSGNLSYRVSSDGITWSAATALTAGRRRTISISSAAGTCYVAFSGTRAVIDNLSVSLSSPAATITVPGNFATIQAAINYAGNGDVIEVAPGTYSDTGNWDLEFRGKAITLRSSDGPERTIIDCGAPTSGTGHRGFYFHGGEDNDTVISGFTVKGGRLFGTSIPSSTSNWSASANHPIGGGIYCEFSSPSIDNCIITDCGAELGGGIGIVGGAPAITNCEITDCIGGGLGAAASGGYGAAIGLIGRSNATISRCVIEGNAAYNNSYGGGLYCWESTAVLSGCRLIGNTASGTLTGGGAYCAGARADVLFQNCVIAGNSANSGAGIFTEWKSAYGSSAYRTAVRVVNCTIAQNEVSSSAAGGGIQESGTDIEVTNSIVWHNTGRALAISGSVSYSNIENGYTGTGNTDETPQFVSLDDDDYHLCSSYGHYNDRTGSWVTDSRNSPCLDAGDPSFSAIEEPDSNGGRINQGAYGGTREASKSPASLTYHVDASGGRDSYNGLSESRPFKTIQKAIDTANSGDTILVWPGTYDEEMTFRGKAITLQSAADAAVISGRHYAFSFYGAESSRSIVSNFVIVGCENGAIVCWGPASPTLKNLTIVNNANGIIAYDGSDPYIINCIFWGNSESDLFDCQAYYSCIEKDDRIGVAGGNIDTDPLFADPGNGDFHLMSAYGRYVAASDSWTQDNVTSPCINKGDVNEDPRAESTPNGNRINMGAYGNTPYASRSN